MRYGVAADHQGTKSVARQFDRLFTDEGVRFHGGVTVGEHVSLDELRAAFDAVVLASGLSADARLAVPGADLPGVVGAGALTRLFNGHPDHHRDDVSLGRRVVVVGQGNVALDVVRLISRTSADLDGSDVDDAVHERVAGDVRVVHVVGRSAPQNAKFDPVMVRELAGLRGIGHTVHGTDLAAVPEGKDARVDAVRALEAAADGSARVQVHWWFGLAPDAIEGTTAAETVVFRGASGEVRLDADAVVTAVGFSADAATLVEPGAHPDGRIEPGLYVAGWLRRGPRGTIPDQRSDSRALARALADDLASGAIAAGAEGVDALDLPARVDFDGWRRIDVRETLSAAPGRVRAKLRTLDDLRAAATDLSIMLPTVDAARTDAGGGEGCGPVTILFGTESGNAELVAEDLARHLGDRADTRVIDLGDLEPADLDSERLHLIVCSTYGDGELPTNVRGLRERLLSERPELAGIRYAVFGLGDRSYSKTYSRGSEMIDEALAACGATRVGEYGRHDAGGPLDAAEVAREWADGVLAELAARELVTR
ncbi:putative ferredoxin/ferredoxin--NADP reductase [Microbacterium sp. Bi128]|nr:putative ferredoxin/ferredoxin--NADP reductase [Microbacterium sp. Bi128]